MDRNGVHRNPRPLHGRDGTAGLHPADVAMSERDIDVLVAEKVMGWRMALEGEKPPQWKNDLVWATGLSAPRNLVKYDWKFTTDPVACKKVREKLAERFDYHLHHIYTIQGGYFRFRVQSLSLGNEVSAEAATEELAVAICALRSVGIELGSGHE